MRQEKSQGSWLGVIGANTKHGGNLKGQQGPTPDKPKTPDGEDAKVAQTAVVYAGLPQGQEPDVVELSSEIEDVISEHEQLSKNAQLNFSLSNSQNLNDSILDSILYYRHKAGFKLLPKEKLDQIFNNNQTEVQQEFKSVVSDLETYKHMRRLEKIHLERFHILSTTAARQGFVTTATHVQMDINDVRRQLYEVREQIQQLEQELEAKLAAMAAPQYIKVAAEIQEADRQEVERLVFEIAHRHELEQIYERNLKFFAERDQSLQVMHEIESTEKALARIQKERRMLEETLKIEWEIGPDVLDHLRLLNKVEIERVIKRQLYVTQKTHTDKILRLREKLDQYDKK